MAHATTQVVTLLLQTIRRNADIVLAESDRAIAGEPRAVHRVRVASRRLRAALPIAADASRSDARDVVRGMRQLARVLGGIREADVVLAWLDASARAPLAPDATARVRDACVADRGAAVRSARSRVARMDVPALVARAHAVADRAEDASPGARGSSVVAAIVGRRSGRLSASLAEAGTTYGVESLHQVRLNAKKLRYSLEAARGWLGASADAARRDLKRLQNLLGQIHDAQAVQRYIRIAAAAPGVSRPMVARLADMARVLDMRCRRLHARVVAGRAGIDETIRGIRRSVVGHLSPRHVGRMARMHSAGRKRRRQAVGA